SYVYRPAAEGELPDFDESTVSRCRKTLQLYRQGAALPVLVSGGSSDPARDPVCAEAMRDLLVQLGVPASDIMVEGSSHPTYENALESAKLLRQRGISKVVLVTDALHLYRSVGCFSKQGIDAVPCGCHYRAEYLEFYPASFVPKPHALDACQHACHEWLGVLWYRVRCRL